MRIPIYVFSLVLTCTITSIALADDAFIANALSDSVTPVDSATILPLRDIPVGHIPQEIAVTPRINSLTCGLSGDTVYVTNSTSNEIIAVDPASKSVKDKITLSCSPTSIAIVPTGTEALIVCRSTGQLVLLDLGQKKETAKIPVSFPHSVAINPSGRFAYVSRSMFSSYVDVIDMASKARIATIGTGRSPQGLVVSPDGKRLFAVNNGQNTVSVIDTATNSVKTTIPVGSKPRNAAISPDGKILYVSNYGSSTVSVIDTATSSVTNTVGVGVNPHGIATDSDGKHLYVSNYTSNTVSIIDTETFQTVATIPTGIGPMGVGLVAVDRIPPEISVTLDTSVLWLPNHKLVNIVADITVKDNCDPDPMVRLVSITSNEPCTTHSQSTGKPGNKANAASPQTCQDIANADFGTDDRSFSLRAERPGTSSEGRIYTITYSVTDAAGNTAYASAAVSVPHDMRTSAP